MTESALKTMIENLPALQRWLSVELKPLCDADPEALTKYVIALMKKNVTEAVLRSSMEEQLDIFLQAETVPFVNRLFDCIRTKEYEQYAEVLPEEAPEDETVNTSTDHDVIHSPPTSLDRENIIEAVSSTDQNEIPLNRKPSSSADMFNQREPSSTESEASDCERDEQNSISLAVEKKRNWRDKRSRSRSLSSDVSPRRKRKGGTGWTKSAGARGRHRWSPIKRRIRRDINRRRRSRSPHPLRSRSASRNTQNISGRGSIDRSRSRSGSPSRRRRISVNPPSPEGNTCNSLLDNMTNKCSVKSVVVKPGSTYNGSCVVRNRCVDFDEKGVCLRGELCPYDHGSDPVILHEIVNNEPTELCSPQAFSGKLPCEKPVNFMNTIVRPPSSAVDEYFPESPSIVPPPPPPFPTFGWGIPRRPLRGRQLGMEPFLGRGGMMRPALARHLGPAMFHGQRQLITIPVEGVHNRGNQSAMTLLPENPFAVGGARMVCRALFGMRGRGRGSFDHNRLGHRSGKSNTNCCLEVRKIPRDLNKIESLISHFSRFGNVVSIQVCFDQDPEGALVTFSSHWDALNAYRATDAVLNNRFIKVFWYNKEPSNNPNMNAGLLNTSDGNMDFLKPAENVTQDDSSSVLNSTNSQCISKQAENPEDKESKLQDEIDKSTVPRDSQIVVQAEATPDNKIQKKSNAFVAAEIQRKQEMMALLNAQIQEQKQLIRKLEVDRSRMTQRQRDEVLKLIKDLQTSCEELKANISCGTTSNSDLEFVTSVSTNAINGQNNYSNDEIKRKLLDAELALYMRERRGR